MKRAACMSSKGPVSLLAKRSGSKGHTFIAANKLHYLRSAVSNGNASSPIFGRMDLFIDLMTVSHALHNDASHFTPLGLIAEKFSCKTH